MQIVGRFLNVSTIYDVRRCKNCQAADDILDGMKLGIKVNADAESFERITRSDAPFAEVWFNVNNEHAYTQLFALMQQRNMRFGLHFWGMLDHNIAPNIAYPDASVVKASMRLIRRTLDIAASHDCPYVNIHPGAAALAKVDYQKERYDCITKPIDIDDAIKLFLENAQSLSAYAKKKHVILTVETVPFRITDGWYDDNTRLTPKNIYELPVSAIVQAARLGLSVANDFCHTAANIIHEDPHAVYTFLYGTTKLLVEQTRLIHLGFVKRPFNGTDNHDSLDNPVLDTSDAVPNIKQMIELLTLFKNRTDVWILVEPKDEHVKNYLLAKKLLEHIR